MVPGEALREFEGSLTEDLWSRWEVRPESGNVICTGSL